MKEIRDHQVPDMCDCLDFPCEYCKIQVLNTYGIIRKWCLTSNNHQYAYNTNSLMVVHNYVCLIEIRDKGLITVCAH